MIRELASMADLANRLLQSHTPGTLSTLFSARGSTYRPLGSMMVGLPGMRAGGISGGCLEEYVARIGERATRSAGAAMLQFSTHRDADEAAPVLGCGGSIEVLVERLMPAHLTLLETFADAAERDHDSLLACIVRRNGEAISVSREWIGSDSTDLAGPRDEAARQARSIHRTISHDTDVLVHHVPAVRRLVIFGAGDDAQPLAEIGASLGWHVTVADRRGRFATNARFPTAQAVLARDWDEAVDAIRFSPRTAVVLMTHSLDDDARILSLVAGQPMAYLGALGPAHRRGWLLEEASALGMPVDGRIASMLRGPIGLDLGDRSSAGIAVAIAAEILAQLNQRDARSLDAAA